MRRTLLLLSMTALMACAPADAAATDAEFLGWGLRWGQSRAEAIAALNKALKPVTTAARLPAGAGPAQDEAVLATLNAIKLGRMPMDTVVHRGSALDFDRCVVLSFYKDGRLHGIEVAAPRQRGQTPSAMFERTVGALHRQFGAVALNTLWEVKKGDRVDVEMSGATAFSPDIWAVAFPVTRAAIDAGTSHALAMMSFDSARMITVRTIDPRMATGNPLYAASALVVDFKPFDAALLKPAP